MMRNKPIREYHDSVKNRKGSGKFSHISTMRKLTRMIFTMLTERKGWRYVNPALTQHKISKLEEAGTVRINGPVGYPAWLIGT